MDGTQSFKDLSVSIGMNVARMPYDTDDWGGETTGQGNFGETSCQEMPRVLPSSAAMKNHGARPYAFRSARRVDSLRPLTRGSG